ncbi:MAG: hypothetical protein Q9190_005425, partial [Brigantiaea leucoxantha]
MTETATTDPLAKEAVVDHILGSHLSTTTSNGNDEPFALRSLCATLHAQITAFLQEDVPTERLRNVQAQTRNSLTIIQNALNRY